MAAVEEREYFVEEGWAALADPGERGRRPRGRELGAGALIACLGTLSVHSADAHAMPMREPVTSTPNDDAGSGSGAKTSSSGPSESRTAAAVGAGARSGASVGGSSSSRGSSSSGSNEVPQDVGAPARRAMTSPSGSSSGSSSRSGNSSGSSSGHTSGSGPSGPGSSSSREVPQHVGAPARRAMTSSGSSSGSGHSSGSSSGASGGGSHRSRTRHSSGGPGSPGSDSGGERRDSGASPTPDSGVPGLGSVPAPFPQPTHDAASDDSAPRPAAAHQPSRRPVAPTNRASSSARTLSREEAPDGAPASSRHKPGRKDPGSARSGRPRAERPSAQSGGYGNEPYDPRLGKGGTPAAINVSDYGEKDQRRIAKLPPPPPSNADDGDCNDIVCDAARELIGDPLHNPVDAVGLLPGGKLLKVPKLVKAVTGIGKAEKAAKGAKETRQVSRARKSEQDDFDHARDATPDEVNVPKGRGTDPAIGKSTPRPLPTRPITRSDLEPKPRDIRDRTTASKPERGQFERRERELGDRQHHGRRGSKPNERDRLGLDLFGDLLERGLPGAAAGGGAAAGASAGGDDHRDRSKDFAAPRGGSGGGPDSGGRRPPAHAPQPPPTHSDASDGYAGMGRKPPPEPPPPYDPRLGRAGTPAQINTNEYSSEDQETIREIEEAKKPPDTTSDGNLGDFLSGGIHEFSFGAVDLGGDEESDAYGAGEVASYVPWNPVSAVRSGAKGVTKLGAKAVEKEVTKSVEHKAERKVAGEGTKPAERPPAAGPPRSPVEPRKAPETRGWQSGDRPDLYAKTRAGNAPSWTTVRTRYWKSRAGEPGAAGRYGGAQNVDRMRRGLAPRRYNADKRGYESMELSHEPKAKRDGGRDVTERWPCDHARVDKFRVPGYCK